MNRRNFFGKVAGAVVAAKVAPSITTPEAANVVPPIMPHVTMPASVRAMFSHHGRAFVVAGEGFYELAPDMQTFTHLGDVENDQEQASICASARDGELFIASGGRAYVYDLNFRMMKQIEFWR